MVKYNYSDEEIKRMLDLYPTMSNNELCKVTGMHINFIMRLSTKHGLIKNYNLRRVTTYKESDVELVKRFGPDKDFKSIVKGTGLSEKVVDSILFMIKGYRNRRGHDGEEKSLISKARHYCTKSGSGRYYAQVNEGAKEILIEARPLADIELRREIDKVLKQVFNG